MSIPTKFIAEVVVEDPDNGLQEAVEIHKILDNTNQLVGLGTHDIRELCVPVRDPYGGEVLAMGPRPANDIEARGTVMMLFDEPVIVLVGGLEKGYTAYGPYVSWSDAGEVHDGDEVVILPLRPAIRPKQT